MSTKKLFQEKLTDLANLTHLEITSSAITSIPETITKLPSLTHLYLSDNPLDQLSSTSLNHLDGLKKVSHFKRKGHLTRNQFIYVPS